ncbi:hypothetical protein [Burkholderia gladioli]|uniref:hypothetical protein n=1 Tax=Burkholderia gladioli TaxID=28095 RepID=UPI0016416F40|nr:hypothetical protein [Burkholderia gladioli]
MPQKTHPPFSSRIPISLAELPTKISYVDALPGVGKSYTSIQKIAVPHAREKHNSILVYAVPTERLKTEIYKSMRAAGIDESLIFQTSSRQGTGRVQDQFRELVVGRDGIRGLPNGSIILTTHECLARIPSDMRARERCVVVYDEARACLEGSSTINLPPRFLEDCLQPRDHETRNGKIVHCPLMTAKEIVTYNGEKISRWCWTDARVEPPEDAAEIIHKFGLASTDQGIRLRDFMSAVHSSALDVFVSSGRRKNAYIVRIVLSPARMFKGYAKVLILSAFFRTSQMYHFLASETVEGVGVPEDITCEFVDRERVTTLLRRLHNVYISYIFDLQERTLSKSDLRSAIVLTQPIADDEKKLWCRRWHDLHAGARGSTFAEIHAAWMSSEEQPLTVGHRQREKFFEFLHDLHDEYGVRGDAVLCHMTRQALRLQRAFFDRFAMKPEPLLIGINASIDARDDGKGTAWKNSRLDTFGTKIEQIPIAAHGLNVYRNRHSCAFLASMKYSNPEANLLRAISDSSYDPEVDRTLDYALQLLWRCNVRAISSDPVLLIVPDRYLAKQLQQRFRSVAEAWLRYEEENSHADACDVPPTSDAVVPRKILHVVAPHSVSKLFRPTVLFAYSYVDAETKSASNKAYRESEKGRLSRELRTIWRDTQEGRRRKQLDDEISLFERKHGKDAAVDARRERDSIPTFSMWRKSEAGMKAERRLQRRGKSRESV